ncbi:hypothetical protein ACI8AC_17920 [Geodermatophilus sp. SYSU D00758]
MPLYAVLLAVVVLDVRAVLFRSGVGGSLSRPVAATAAAIALVLVTLLAVDLRRQVLLAREPDRTPSG